MRHKNFLLMTLAASTFLLASCFENETQDNNTAAANSPSSITGVYCQKAQDKNTSLAVIQDENNDLRFSISVWNNASGNDCGIVNGVARNTGDGQWLYQSEEDGSACSVTITEQNGLTFSQQGQCPAMCGRNASIGEAHNVSQAAKIGSDVTQEDLDGLYEAPFCP